MGPAQAYVFIDEHPDSLNYGDFAVAMNDGVAPTRIYMIDVPASSHNGAGGLSFADGHAEVHRWLDPRTRVPVSGNYMSSSVVSSPNNRDMIYLSQHASIRAE
jgi:prepilin-type processing-associated H-X9-DG protein